MKDAKYLNALVQLINKLRMSSMPCLAKKDHHYQFYSKYDHSGKLFSSISKHDFEWEFVHLAEAIRELPRSLAAMLTLGLLSTLDPKLADVAMRVMEHCAASSLFNLVIMLIAWIVFREPIIINFVFSAIAASVFVCILAIILNNKVEGYFKE